ncbi:MAG: RidA family protein [Candidatus Dadabacteria bacterium]|nr:MAG: RidA family protein [Candidatus Dadabacteria bacterium]
MAEGQSGKAIATDRAPAAVGPYSQAVRVGPWLWCSGQIPLDPRTGRLVEGGIAEQTRQCLKNLEAVLSAGGATPASVVKTTVYLARIEDFAAFNEIYGDWVGDPPPARATVAVSSLPKGALVEIDAVAYVGESG